MTILAPRGDDEKPAETPAAPPPSKITDNLFKARTIILFGEITQKVAQSTVAQLLALAEENSEPIRVIINSQGGHVESGDSIHDMVKFIRPKVQMIGTGWVASAGVHIFLAAAKENRYCLPNTRFMIHQPLGGAGGPASDIAIEAKEIIKMRKRINQSIADATGQAFEKVERDTDRNFWMGPDEARSYGIVTHVIKSIDELK
ncbi:MAG TPA: ATP-dependent Clp protease proteolytic subunit [Methylomirabilota bacterium]|nr:ATP-dependent Clp protease proteolytic subunit [Methylomirabilota bacterium]